VPRGRRHGHAPLNATRGKVFDVSRGSTRRVSVRVELVLLQLVLADVLLQLLLSTSLHSLLSTEPSSLSLPSILRDSHPTLVVNFSTHRRLSLLTTHTRYNGYEPHPSTSIPSSPWQRRTRVSYWPCHFTVATEARGSTPRQGRERNEHQTCS